MNLALGPVARLMTRGLYALLQTRFAWCDWLQPTPETEVELTFWAESLVIMHCQSGTVLVLSVLCFQMLVMWGMVGTL